MVAVFLYFCKQTSGFNFTLFIFPGRGEAMFQRSRVHCLSEITDFLFVTSFRGADSPTALRAKGITCIINATCDKHTNHDMSGFDVISIPVNDVPEANLRQYFDVVAEKIRSVKKDGGKTVVHCHAGRSRSVTLVLAYLMRCEHMTLHDAYKLVKLRRELVRPNIGFWIQLCHYEKKMYGKNSVQMIPSPIGTIPDVYSNETKNMWPI
ncbi:dual specificity protein phosphatase 14-like [Antedon mediterranea]|uniref:dual specificity protein phosphatase 14-like n=1 Tax=Antedon mediterranea TaxID=105859 RepID=UPI003AF80A89